MYSRCFDVTVRQCNEAAASAAVIAAGYRARSSREIGRPSAMRAAAVDARTAVCVGLQHGWMPRG
jgi:hypothetical protein